MGRHRQENLRIRAREVPVNGGVEPTERQMKFRIRRVEGDRPLRLRHRQRQRLLAREGSRWQGLVQRLHRQRPLPEGRVQSGQLLRVGRSRRLECGGTLQGIDGLAVTWDGAGGNGFDVELLRALVVEDARDLPVAVVGKQRPGGKIQEQAGKGDRHQAREKPRLRRAVLRRGVRDGLRLPPVEGMKIARG
jgi:hypothetical protein